MMTKHHQHQHHQHHQQLRFTPFNVIVFTFISLTGIAYSSEFYNIGNADEFVAFAKSVNNDGTTFEGTTVFLTGDIDFSSLTTGTFEPVGKAANTNFAGVFDGQGYAIKNLVVDSPDFRYTGLFGYSNGLTIRNLVVDESCSFSSSYSYSGDSDAFVSGIIGTYEVGTDGRPCNVENVMNMAAITYHGSGRNFVVTGGIAGKCSGKCVLANCVNFGPILAKSDESSWWIYSGGIVGEAEGKYGSVLIKSCINYGSVTNDIRGRDVISVGGIVGVVWSNIAIENCLSAGPVSSNKTAATSSYLGSIMGGRKLSTSEYKNNTVQSCFWTEGVCDCNSSGEVIEDVTVLNSTDTQGVEMNESTLAMLYDLINPSGSSNFVVVHLNGGTIENSTGDGMIFIKNHVPIPVKEGYSFVTWCTDSNCKGMCNPDDMSLCDSKDLYAGWDRATVTILTRDGNNSTITKDLEFGQLIELPGNLTKEGYTFVGWDNTTSTVPGHDLVISAFWLLNSYTLIFDFDNGTEPEMSTSFFRESIVYPEDPKKEGYLFIGWDSNLTKMPARKLTIKALWEEIVVGNVEIVFTTKDITQESIEAVIKKFTDSEFTIVEISSADEGTTVIVKFVDENANAHFVRAVNEEKDSTIKHVGIVPDSGGTSFSVSMFSPSPSSSSTVLFFV